MQRFKIILQFTCPNIKFAQDVISDSIADIKCTDNIMNVVASEVVESLGIDTDDNKGIEFWYNKTTGKYVEVYERNSAFVRYQTNRQNDMTLQGHAQLDWETFSKEYQFVYQGVEE